MKNVDPVNKLRFIWFGGESSGSWARRTTSTI
jgi:hypothetical protein